jgi:hypothetical protein
MAANNLEVKSAEYQRARNRAKVYRWREVHRAEIEVSKLARFCSMRGGRPQFAYSLWTQGGRRAGQVFKIGTGFEMPAGAISEPCLVLGVPVPAKLAAGIVAGWVRGDFDG